MKRRGKRFMEKNRYRMDIFEQIFDNNKAWIKMHQEKDPHFFQSLSEGQNPEILYIGCSDSRVTAEEMTGVQPGQMFVHRNVANLVPNNDNNSAAVIEYAIAHLKVKHVVVCGHYYCGGIKSAMQSMDLGILNPWLRNIRDVYRFHKAELNAIADEDLRYKRLVELNVIEQCINVIKMAVWQKHYLKSAFPKIHALVFDIHSGELIDLNFDFQREALNIREIYDLGTQKK
jgi:carbonic anhydrase